MPLTKHEIEVVKKYQDLFEGDVNTDKIVQLSLQVDSEALRADIEAVAKSFCNSLHPEHNKESMADRLVNNIMERFYSE